MKNKKFYKNALETSFLFSFSIWLYVIAMQIAHPESVKWTFTEWFRVPMDIVGQTAFIISVISFFLLRYKFSK